MGRIAAASPTGTSVIRVASPRGPEICTQRRSGRRRGSRHRWRQHRRRSRHRWRGAAEVPSGSALAALGQEALLLAVAVSLPVVAIAALVGLLVAVLQAATQVQDVTLGHLPRLPRGGRGLGADGHLGWARKSLPSRSARSTAVEPVLSLAPSDLVRARPGSRVRVAGRISAVHADGYETRRCLVERARRRHRKFHIRAGRSAGLRRRVRRANPMRRTRDRADPVPRAAR